MSRVRQHGTRAELSVARVLRSLGQHYRLNVRSLPGSPDFANKRRKWAIFVHGCFWHQHTGCPRASVPKRNREFWRNKFIANRRRDASAITALRRLGFKVVVVWECQVDEPDEIVCRLSNILESRCV